MILIVAQNLTTQKDDASINYLIAAELGIIIFAQNILDIGVNRVPFAGGTVGTGHGQRLQRGLELIMALSPRRYKKP